MSDSNQNELVIGPFRDGKRKLTYGSVTGLVHEDGDGYRGELVSHTGMTQTMRRRHDVLKWFVERAREILAVPGLAVPDSYATLLDLRPGSAPFVPDGEAAAFSILAEPPTSVLEEAAATNPYTRGVPTNKFIVGRWKGDQRVLGFGSVRGVERKVPGGYSCELTSHTGMTFSATYSYEVRKWFIENAKRILGRRVIVLEPGDDGWWIATVEGVPGAHSQGRTMKEAAANVLDAMEELFAAREGLPS